MRPWRVRLRVGGWLVAGFLAACFPVVVGGFADSDSVAGCFDVGAVGEVGAEGVLELGGEFCGASHLVIDPLSFAGDGSFVCFLSGVVDGVGVVDFAVC